MTLLDCNFLNEWVQKPKKRERKGKVFFYTRMPNKFGINGEIRELTNL